jgi:hypothetical protein
MHILIGLLLFFFLLALVFGEEAAQKFYKLGFIFVAIGVALLLLYFIAHSL